MASNDHAFLIAVGDYHELNSLKGPVADARKFGQWLTAADGGGIPDGQIYLFFSENSTQADPKPRLKAIGDKLRELEKISEGIGRIYFYFSGHGLGWDKFETLFLMSEWSYDYADSCLSTANATEFLLNQTSAQQVFFFLDCCRDYKPPGVSINPFKFGTQAINNVSEGDRDIIIFHSTTYGSKSYEYEYADPEEKIFGYFTAQLLRGLRGKKGLNNLPPISGQVTAEALKNFLEHPIQTHDQKVQSGRALTELPTSRMKTLEFGPLKANILPENLLVFAKENGWMDKLTEAVIKKTAEELQGGTLEELLKALLANDLVLTQGDGIDLKNVLGGLMGKSDSDTQSLSFETIEVKIPNEMPEELIPSVKTRFIHEKSQTSFELIGGGTFSLPKGRYQSISTFRTTDIEPLNEVPTNKNFFTINKNKQQVDLQLSNLLDTLLNVQVKLLFRKQYPSIEALCPLIKIYINSVDGLMVNFSFFGNKSLQLPPGKYIFYSKINHYVSQATEIEATENEQLIQIDAPPLYASSLENFLDTTHEYYHNDAISISKKPTPRGFPNVFLFIRAFDNIAAKPIAASYQDVLWRFNFFYVENNVTFPRLPLLNTSSDSWSGKHFGNQHLHNYNLLCYQGGNYARLIPFFAHPKNQIQFFAQIEEKTAVQKQLERGDFTVRFDKLLITTNIVSRQDPSGLKDDYSANAPYRGGDNANYFLSLALEQLLEGPAGTTEELLTQLKQWSIGENRQNPFLIVACFYLYHLFINNKVKPDQVSFLDESLLNGVKATDILNNDIRVLDLLGNNPKKRSFKDQRYEFEDLKDLPLFSAGVEFLLQKSQEDQTFLSPFLKEILLTIDRNCPYTSLIIKNSSPFAEILWNTNVK